MENNKEPKQEVIFEELEHTIKVPQGIRPIIQHPDLKLEINKNKEELIFESRDSLREYKLKLESHLPLTHRRFKILCVLLEKIYQESSFNDKDETLFKYNDFMKNQEGILEQKNIPRYFKQKIETLDNKPRIARFTLYELAKRLNLKPGGTLYKELKEEIREISKIHSSSEITFFKYDDFEVESGSLTRPQEEVLKKKRKDLKYSQGGSLIRYSGIEYEGNLAGNYYDIVMNGVAYNALIKGLISYSRINVGNLLSIKSEIDGALYVYLLGNVRNDSGMNINIDTLASKIWDKQWEKFSKGVQRVNRVRMKKSLVKDLFQQEFDIYFDEVKSIFYIYRKNYITIEQKQRMLKYKLLISVS